MCTTGFATFHCNTTLDFFLFLSSMLVENFADTVVRCSKRCFAFTFDVPNYVSKASKTLFVLSFGVAVSSLRRVSNAVDEI